MNVNEITSNQVKMPTLVKERRANYIKALRSGDYTQCRDVYTSQGDFCAVGLAMDLTHEAMESTHEACDVDDKTIEDMLTNTAEDFYFCPFHIEDLIKMNDDMEMTFNQIADKLVDMGFLTDAHYQRLPSTVYQPRGNHVILR